MYVCVVIKSQVQSSGGAQWSLQEFLARHDVAPWHLLVQPIREVLLDRWFSGKEPFEAQISQVFGQ